MMESLRSVIFKQTVRQKTHDRQNTLNPKSAFQNLKFAFKFLFIDQSDRFLAGGRGLMKLH
ncbi:hypothetical protein D1AOALGA4SA_2146 [Olavius algarvensis Delta 1 endosymbiont]|nr:hypothetical protein D1AOALGA4SA_2146 [Olavius algarvensis Delta 1 endosymbiont]